MKRLTKQSSIERVRAVTKNFFLHFQSPKIHVHSLNPSFTYGLGILNLSLFIILLISGLLLMIYYRPTIAHAYNSILDINHVVTGGRYLRNMHRWAAHGLVFLSIIHMSRIVYTGSYSRGRSLTWNIGICLLFITLLSSFSGYLLPWDQLGFWAVTIASNIVSSTKELTDTLSITAYFDPGLVIKKLLLGGTDVEQNTLTRFYFLHIIFLPILFILFTGWHFWRIRKSGGLNLPDRVDQIVLAKDHLKEDKTNLKKNEYLLFSWPIALWAEISIFLVSLAVLSIFAFFIDAPLKELADPAMPENPAKAPWYFLGVQELVSYSSFGGGILVPLLITIALISFPYVDREDKNTGLWFAGSVGLRTALYSGIFSFLVIIILISILAGFGWVRDWFPSIPTSVLILINPGVITSLIFAVYALVIVKQTQSKRIGIIALYTCILTGFALFTLVGIWFRGPDWEFTFLSIFNY
jgi:quinol-cytochrome oxidoreductase complex cytochrome b subunit